MKQILKELIKYPISGTARKEVKNYFTNKKIQNIKLVMTLVVKNEQDIIETHIRFHKAMGVDAFIVTDHNSTDHTVQILNNLKTEGFTIEIIGEKSIDHQHSVWVKRMIKTAKHKYKADWVINSDADEFYYSKSLDLKKSIYDTLGANVIWVDSIFLFPDGREDFLSCPYFVTRTFNNFEAEELNISQHPIYSKYIEVHDCSKVIHSTKGFKKINDGNHDCNMHNKIKIQSADINLYHYHIKNYKQYESKVLRWIDSAKLMPQGMGEHVKNMIDLYKEGKLEENYATFFGSEAKDFLVEHGVVTKDPSVHNFLKYKKIYK